VLAAGSDPGGARGTGGDCELWPPGFALKGIQVGDSADPSTPCKSSVVTVDCRCDCILFVDADCLGLHAVCDCVLFVTAHCL